MDIYTTFGGPRSDNEEGLLPVIEVFDEDMDRTYSIDQDIVANGGIDVDALESSYYGLGVFNHTYYNYQDMSDASFWDSDDEEVIAIKEAFAEGVKHYYIDHSSGGEVLTYNEEYPTHLWHPDGRAFRFIKDLPAALGEECAWYVNKVLENWDNPSKKEIAEMASSIIGGLPQKVDKRSLFEVYLSFLFPLSEAQAERAISGIEAGLAQQKLPDRLGEELALFLRGEPSLYEQEKELQETHTYQHRENRALGHRKPKKKGYKIR